jgi:hypothetical protein
MRLWHSFEVQQQYSEVLFYLTTLAVVEIDMVGEMNGKATSGFCREVAENCALLGHYAPSNGNYLPMFRDNLSVHFQGSRIKKSARNKPLLAA